jgi:3-deoxy-7-phosphoheptulonate synthase
MIESFLVPGRQEITERSSMTFGQSVTDGCLGWDTTVPVLRELADGVRQRRARG